MAICFIMGPEARKKWSAVHRAVRAECTKLPSSPRRRGGALYLVIFMYNHSLIKVAVKHTAFSFWRLTNQKECFSLVARV